MTILQADPFVKVVVVMGCLPGRSLWVVFAERTPPAPRLWQPQRQGVMVPTNLSFTTTLGGMCKGLWVVFTYGGDFFLRDRVGGTGETSWLWALFPLTRLYPVGVRNSN